MNFFTNLFKKEQKEVTNIPEQPFLRELVKEEAKREQQETDPVKARTNEALEKLISKIREKHFSPEIQKALKEMKGPLGSYVTMSIVSRNGRRYRDAMINDNDIIFGYTYNRDWSLYNYKEEYVHEYLIDTIEAYEETKDYIDVNPNNMYKKVSEKLFIEHLYDYFFNGQLEKDIEYRTKENRNYETRKKKEEIEAADKLCKLTKDL